MGAVARDAFRFPSPLNEPDVPVASIRLSDRIHSRLTDERLGVSPDAGRRADQRGLDPAPGADADLGGACSEKIERERRQGGQPPDRPAPGSRSGRSSTRLALGGGAGLAPRATGPGGPGSGGRSPSVAFAPHSSGTDWPPYTDGHPSKRGAAQGCTPESQNSPCELP
jgi:hypothetical protein